jgi:hypothetical protein
MINALLKNAPTHLTEAAHCINNMSFSENTKPNNTVSFIFYSNNFSRLILLQFFTVHLRDKSRVILDSKGFWR